MRLRNRLFPVFLVALGGLSYSAVPAAASTGHAFSSPGFGSISDVQSVAVDQASGDVYVYSGEEAGSIHIFTASGQPAEFSALGEGTITDVGPGAQGQSQIAVDNSPGPGEGNIYVATNSTLLIYGSGGEKLGEIAGGEACGVAVDPVGNVYVGLYPETIDEYVPTASPIVASDLTAHSSADLEGVCNLAVGGGGEVYAADATGIVKLEGLSAIVPASIDSFGSTLAVDQVTGEVFIDEGGAIAQYDSSGNRVAAFAQVGEGAIGGGSYGVAVNQGTGDIYVSNAEAADIEVFRPGPTPPSPNTEPATVLTGTTATLHGELMPAGETVEFYFSYAQGPSCLGPNAISTPIDNQGQPASGGGGGIQESVQVEGLEGNTQYAFCLVAQNAYGATPGTSVQFVTSKIKPVVVSESGSPDGPTEATLFATIAPGNLLSSYHFEYGLEASVYGLGAPIPEAELGSTPASIEQKINGLKPGTTYHFRVVANNSVGTEYGPDETFETPPLAPAATLEPASDVTTTSATLSATLDPNGAQASYHFYYYPTGCTNFELFLETCASGVKIPVPEGEVEPEAGAASVMIQLNELRPATTYFYYVKARGAGGTAGGFFAKVLSFTTLPLPPVVSAAPVTDLGTSSVIVVGLVNPEGGATTYYVEYGLTSLYGAVGPGPSGDAGSVEAGVPISAHLSDLESGTEYHYRVVARNSGGITYGPDEVFVTSSPYPSVLGSVPAGTFVADVLEAPDVIYPSLNGLSPLPRSTSRVPAVSVPPRKNLVQALKRCKVYKSASKRHRCERSVKAKYGAGKVDGQRR
jgi:hypothetical protein